MEVDKATGRPDPSRPDLIGIRAIWPSSPCASNPFARIKAALGMDVGDYYPQGKGWWFRLHEKVANATSGPQGGGIR